MATVVHSATGFSRFNPLPALVARLGRIATAWQEHRRRSRELRELYSLEERDLRDLGLSRSDFMAIHNGTYRRE